MGTLPPRVKGSYLARKPKVKMDTNLFKVKFDPNVTVGIYSVKFNPAIQYDNRSLRLKLLTVAKEKLRDSMGDYVINGATVFTVYKEGVSKDQQTVDLVEGDTGYQLAFKKVKTVKLSDVYDADGKKAAPVFGFLNNLIKEFLRKLDYHEIGKSRKYFKHKDKVDLPSAGVVLYKGYGTSFVVLESGAYLKIDSSTRVVQNASALSSLNSTYAVYKDLDKDAKRNKIKGEFIGQVVMANYGNHRYWRVEDMVFDMDTDQIMAVKDSNESLTEYYQKKYSLTITKKKQPLFKVKLNEVRVKKGESQPEKEQDILLVPEFCLLSGLPDDFDERKRRDVSRETIVAPNIKRGRIDELINKFDKELKDFGPNSLRKGLTLDIANKCETIEAINLGAPHLALGNNNAIEENKAAQFMLFNKPLYTTDVPLNIMIFAGQQVNIKSIEDVVYPTSKNIRINCKIKVTTIDYRDRNCMSIIANFLADKECRYKEYNMFWFILPFGMKTKYGEIKRMAMESENPKLTQMTVDSTLGKKGFQSICTKILLQMASKVGNALWLPRPPKSSNPNTMMLGIDTAADKVQKGVIAAYCASLAPNFSKFYSNYILQENAQELTEKGAYIVSKSIDEYVKHNKTMPEEVIVMKNGCADSQISAALEMEVKEVKDAVDRMGKKEGKYPALTYIIVDKNVNQKLFRPNGDKMNPSFGTLVNTNIVSKDYDFYMIAQHCNMGTVKPAYYKVIYSDSKVEEGVLQELLYTQCFNYMNWTGSVRVPACLQYAKKLSQLIGQYVNNKDTQTLSKNLYFI